METQQKFKRAMNDMDIELILLGQHKSMLLEQLQILEEKKIEKFVNEIIYSKAIFRFTSDIYNNLFCLIIIKQL